MLPRARVEMGNRETKDGLTKWLSSQEGTKWSLNRVGKVRKAYQKEHKRRLAGDKLKGPQKLGNPLPPTHGGHVGRSGEGKNDGTKATCSPRCLQEVLLIKCNEAEV